MSNNKEQEFDIISLMINLWHSKTTVIIWTICGAVVGLLLALSIPKTYTVNVAFAPEVEQKLGSGVSSIASMMGVSLNNSVDAISVEMFPDVLASTPFVYNLLDLQVESRDGEINTTLLDYMDNYQKKAWWSHVLGFPFKVLGYIMHKPDLDVSDSLDLTNLPPKYRAVIGNLKRNISISQDNKTGKIEVSLTMQDPVIASTVLEKVVDDLKAYICDYRTAKDRQDVDNLTLICEQRKNDYYEAQKAYADYSDAHKNLVMHSVQMEQLRLQQEMQLAYQVYSQVATQLEGVRIKEQQSKPVFVILEPVIVPLKGYPSKMKMMVVFAFFAAFISLFWIILGKKYYHIIKSKWY